MVAEEAGIYRQCIQAYIGRLDIGNVLNKCNSLSTWVLALGTVARVALSSPFFFLLL